MIKSVAQAEQYSEKYDIPVADILAMGLNLSGIDFPMTEDPRGRFPLSLYGVNEPRFFAITMNPKKPTGYSHDGNIVYLGGQPIGEGIIPEKDTCDESYPRMGGLALTLNTNVRSDCRGCAFCGNQIADGGEMDLTVEKNLVSWTEQFMRDKDVKSLEYLDNIGVVTGCFDDEEKVVDHLLLLRDVFTLYGFDGEIKYIGSQIQSDSALERLAAANPIGIYLTVEHFTRREKFLKKTKQVPLESGREILSKATSLGMQTSFLYILGLDPLDSIWEELPKYAEGMLTRHPLLNLMQAYVPNQEKLRIDGGQQMDYYIKGRQIFEQVFGPLGLVPRMWECYRAPWTTKYGPIELSGPFI